MWLALVPLAAAQPGPSSVGPLVVESGDVRVRPRLVVQLLATESLQDGELEGDVRIRRLRTGLELEGVEGNARAALQVNLAPGATELLDVWVEAGKAAFLRVGLLRTPFTRHREQSATQLALVDWTVAPQAFGGERQMGVAASTGPAGSHRVDAVLGVYSGENARRSFGTLVADAHGIELPNPSDLANGASSPARLHPEVMGRISFGRVDGGTPYDHEGGPLRGLLAASAAVDAAPDPQTEMSQRVALESLAKVHGLGLAIATYGGWFRQDRGVAELAGTGVLVEATAKVDEHVGVAALASRVQTTAALRDTAALRTGVAAFDTRSEVLGGGVWFLEGTGLCLQLDLGWVSETSIDGDAGAMRTRAQLQLVL